jgi:hypothetical protein
MNFIDLPDGLKYEILKRCDPLSCIRTIATCRQIKQQFPIQVILVKRQQFRALKRTYQSLNEMTKDVKQWLDEHIYKEDVLYIPQKIHHVSIHPKVELKFTKNEKGRCSFILSNSDISQKNKNQYHYQMTQLIWEPDYHRYRWILLNNMNTTFKIPILLLWLGFQVLMSIHGWVSFQHLHFHEFYPHTSIPEWIQRLLCSQQYNGMLMDAILDQSVEL